MNAQDSLLASPVVADLGWFLAHVVWQGTLSALALAALLALIDERFARIRYALSTATLAFMLMMPLFTAFAPSALPTTAEALRAAGNQHSTEGVTSGPALVPSVALRVAMKVPALAPWFVPMWLCGVCLLTLRSCAGWRAASALTRSGVSEMPEPVFRRFIDLKRRFGLTCEVVFRQSSRAEVPAVIGYFRPVLLLPVSAVSGMPVAELDAIIAHELAHIRRDDYLVNTLQHLAEILLFFHPAVWWVSSRVRREREHCCDDLAVLVCGDVVAYGSALLSLEERRGAAPRLALAATHAKLPDRIRRLIRRTEVKPGTTTVMLPFVLAGILLAVAVVTAGQFESSTTPQYPLRAAGEARETTPPPALELVRLSDETTDRKTRIEIVDRLSGKLTPEAWNKLMTIAESDPDLEVRKVAISYVAGRPSVEALSTLYDKADNQEIKLHILSYIHGLQSEAAITKVRSIAKLESNAAVRLKAIDYLSGR